MTRREIDNLLNGLEGKRVPAGPSGAPTRGMSNVLPTGKNFYSVDVRAIPSRFSWQIGQRLADSLLEKFLADNGRYPECVGITVWGTANMRTRGDDVAEILWLWGIRPKWNADNQRVMGIEPISLQELKRPRIDVTVRMSGFFRDAFPGVVRLLDDAVRMAADLDEPEEMNFIRRRVQRDQRTLVESGCPAEEAADRARFRLFSNKPGAYGTGILEAVTAGTWSSAEDLAEIYLNWGSYAYSRSHYGTRGTDGVSFPARVDGHRRPEPRQPRTRYFRQRRLSAISRRHGRGDPDPERNSSRGVPRRLVDSGSGPRR